jgi:hypothetical protein
VASDYLIYGIVICRAASSQTPVPKLACVGAQEIMMNRSQYIVDHQEQAEKGHAEGAGTETFQLMLRPTPQESTGSETSTLLELILRPLQIASTGREGLSGMLLGVLAAARSEPDASLTASRLPRNENVLPLAPRWEISELMRIEILRRLQHSVYEGELPENACVQILSCLCVSFANGLAVSLNDGISQTWLETSITCFVEKLGFHKIRMEKRSACGSTSVRGPVLVKSARKAVGGLREQQLHVSPGS